MMVFTWSAVGGVFSITSRLNRSGGAEDFPGGYGEERADCKIAKALLDGGEEGL